MSYLDGGYANPFEGLDDLVVGLYAVYGNTAALEFTIDGWNRLMEQSDPEPQTRTG